MLECCQGVNCQASNFLRAFDLIPQANALGLLEPDIGTGVANVGLLVQTSCRFLLEQIHSEISDDLFDVVAGLPFQCRSRCDLDHKQVRDTSPFVVDLSYQLPSASKKSSKKAKTLTFVDVLKLSFNKETITKAWCPDCQAYKLTTTSKSLVRAPNYIFLNANVTSDAELDLWLSSEQPNSTWLPMAIAIILKDEELEIIDLDKSGSDCLASYPKSCVSIYDLRATIAEIKTGKAGPKSGHLVGHINVSDDAALPKWHLFNDFIVQKNEEATMFKKWKVPCLMQYARRSMETSSSFFLSPVEPDFRILTSNQIVNRRQDLFIKFVPFSEAELPRSPGYLCAIDAEFVAMTKADVEIRSDGTKKVLRPPKYSLARVSVVRGEGLQEGVPFIDDYICMTEPVDDYLTEFSGIKNGDLDPIHSQHPLVSLKVAYKRLRLLVDMGCVFVGHDLRKDCRTINLHIPPSQIIDTVKLFKLNSRKRSLSLRFLSWSLLGKDIQENTHDSIEDAQTALKLYKKYLEIKKAGRFEEIMEKIYQDGAIYNFRPPGRERTKSHELF